MSESLPMIGPDYWQRGEQLEVFQRIDMFDLVIIKLQLIESADFASAVMSLI